MNLGKLSNYISENPSGINVKHQKILILAFSIANLSIDSIDCRAKTKRTTKDNKTREFIENL